MLKSRTKIKIENDDIEKLFNAAGIEGVSDIAPLGAGEYNSVFSAKADGGEYAIKIAPTDDVSVMTYEKGIMVSEVFWYKQMKELSPIKVPEIYYADFAKELIPSRFYIMEKLSGVQLDKMKLSKSEKEESVAEMTKMAAQMHKIKNDRFGYIQNGLYDDWHQAIKAMAGAVLDDCSSKGRKSRRGEKLLKYIDKYEAVLKKAECCMVNFDIWPPNIICKRENGSISYAWIDPERSFWGDRIVDFVCLDMTKPLAEKRLSLAAYNTIADKPVAATEDEKIRYAVAQGYLGLIMEVEKYFRYTPFNFGWWRNVIASAWLFKSAFGILKKGRNNTGLLESQLELI